MDTCRRCSRRCNQCGRHCLCQRWIRWSLRAAARRCCGRGRGGRSARIVSWSIGWKFGSRARVCVKWSCGNSRCWGVIRGGFSFGPGDGELIDPCHSSSVVNAAFWGAIGGGISKYFPTKNLNTWSQASYFGPSTIAGLFGSGNAWINNGGAAASAAVGAAANFPIIGPF
jgi:hypothetical protein